MVRGVSAGELVHLETNDRHGLGKDNLFALASRSLAASLVLVWLAQQTAGAGRLGALALVVHAMSQPVKRLTFRTKQSKRSTSRAICETCRSRLRRFKRRNSRLFCRSRRLAVTMCLACLQSRVTIDGRIIEPTRPCQWAPTDCTCHRNREGAFPREPGARLARIGIQVRSPTRRSRIGKSFLA